MKKACALVLAVLIATALFGCNVAPNVPRTAPYTEDGVYDYNDGTGNYNRGTTNNATGRQTNRRYNPSDNVLATIPER